MHPQATTVGRRAEPRSFLEEIENKCMYSALTHPLTLIIRVWQMFVAKKLTVCVIIQLFKHTLNTHEDFRKITVQNRAAGLAGQTPTEEKCGDRCWFRLIGETLGVVGL